MASPSSLVKRIGNELKGRAPGPRPAPESRYWWRVPPARNESDVVAYIVNRQEMSRRSDYSWHGLWYLIAANFLGRQWATWSNKSGILSDPGVDKKEILLTFNRIKPIVLRECSKLTMGSVPWTAVPTSADDKAMASARVDVKLLEHYWEVMQQREAENRGNMTRILFGMSITYPHWDHVQGKLIGTTDDGRPEYEGLPVMSKYTPFHFHHDASAKSPDEQRWCSLEEMIDVNLLELMYPRGVDVMPQKPDPTMYLAHRIQNLSSHNFANVTRTDDPQTFKHHSRLIRHWEYPNIDWPNGRETHTAGNIVLYDGEWQASYATTGFRIRHPLIVDYYIKMPERYKGVGLVEDLLESQWEYNKTRSQFTKIKNKCAKPKWLSAKGHGLGTAPSDEPNELVEYNHIPEAPSLKPEPVTMNIPVGAFAEHWTTVTDDLQEISSQHDVSRAQVPGGVKSGVAIGLLQEADDMAKGHPMNNHLSALKSEAHAVLGLYRDYGPEKMIVSIAGSQFEHEYAQWVREKSRADTRIEILMDSGLPMSRVQRKQEMYGLIEAGIIDVTDPIQKNMALKFAQVGLADEYFHQQDLHAIKARRENQQMLESQTFPMVGIEDDHEIHMQEHLNEVIRNPDMDLQLKSLFMAHNEWHLAHFKEQSQQLAEQQAIAAGAMTPSGGGQAQPSQVEDHRGEPLPPEDKPGPQAIAGDQAGGPGGGAGPPKPGSSGEKKSPPKKAA